MFVDVKIAGGIMLLSGIISPYPTKEGRQEILTQADNNAIIKPRATSHSQNSALVSIIIPAYNTAPYIHRAIGSSLRQTHKNIEILIIDDGSTDDTLKVAEYFAGTDSRIRVFTQKNAGVSAARNHGIDEAKGEYLYFLDSDDWLEDGAIETLLDAQREQPDKVICADYYNDVEIEGGRLLRNGSEGEMTPSYTLTLRDVAETYFWLKEPYIFHNASAKLFRAPFSARFPEGITHAEDAVFFIRYLLQSGGEAYYINKPILNVLAREGSATRSKYKPTMFDSYTATYDILIGLMNDEDSKKLMLISYIHDSCGWLFQAVRYHADIGEIRRIKSVIRAYSWDIIKCRRHRLKTRLRFFIGYFAPVPVCKFFVFMLDFVRSLLAKKRPSEIITNWQDFPKVPGL